MTTETLGPLCRLPLPEVTLPTLSDTASRLLNQRDPTAQVSVAHCVTCKGRKTFRWFAPGSRDEIVRYECPCKDQYILYRWMLNAGIRKQYQRLAWPDLISPDPAVVEFLDQSDWHLDSGTGLILNGDKGNGKSMTAYLILKWLINKGVTVHATTFSDMIESFKDGWESREQARWFDRTVRNAGVLYIDDLGREYKGQKVIASGLASAGERMLEAVVRSRVASDQTTIITTNLNEKEIEQGYGGHIMSLLSECSEVITLASTEDWRPQKRLRDRQEMREQLTRPLVLL